MRNTATKQVKVVTQNNLEFSATLTLNDGYNDRITDILNDDRSFIPLTDVKVYKNNQFIYQISFMCLNKYSIFFIAYKSENLLENRINSPKSINYTAVGFES